MTASRKRLILLELNEINFDVVANYIRAEPSRFPSLNRLLTKSPIRTSCEKRYEELEPWIQWASVHTGMTYAEHGVFRLGDMVGAGVPQLFEQLEHAGYAVGAVSAMNAVNRLENPAYFIPDPWTQTPADSSWWSRSLSQAISQAVNDNAQCRITPKSLLQILLGLMRFAQLKHYSTYFSMVANCRRKPWCKAMLLDLLLHDVHWHLFEDKQPHFSTLFLNAGAHIQHHYFLNSAPIRKESQHKNPSWYVPENEDPLADVLELYDVIIGEYFSRTDCEVMLATGLAQKPYDRLKFYYRLNNHAQFLQELGISFKAVFPRMTRDFLIEFANQQHAHVAQEALSNLRVVGENTPLFGAIDNRGDSLFVTLSYPNEITPETHYELGDRRYALLPKVSFVAIKNGMHQEQGFAFFTPGIASYAPANLSHVAQLGNAIKSFFGLSVSQ